MIVKPLSNEQWGECRRCACMGSYAAQEPEAEIQKCQRQAAIEQKVSSPGQA